MPIGPVIEELRRTFHGFDDGAFRVAVATMISNMMEQRPDEADQEFVIAEMDPLDPVWTLLIAPPACGKTEIISMLNGFPSCYEILEFTSKTLASGHTRADHLLPRLTNKTVLIKDMSAVFSKRDFEIAAIIDQLRQVYDGRIRFDWGSGRETFEWKGKVGLLAGATEDIYERRSVMAEMGDRFLYYPVQYPRDSASRQRVAQTARRNSRYDGALRRGLRDHVHDYLHEVVGAGSVYPDSVLLPDEIGARLDVIAEMATRARSYVPRNYRHEVIAPPQIEGSARMAKALDLLVRALAIAAQRLTVSERDVSLVRRTAFGATRPIRRRLILYFFQLWRSALERGAALPEPVRATDVVQATGENRSSVYRTLEDLTLLELVQSEQRAGGARHDADTAEASPDGRGRPPRVYYMPRDTAERVAQLFGVSLDTEGTPVPGEETPVNVQVEQLTLEPG